MAKEIIDGVDYSKVFPAGSTGEVQFNDTGAFGADSNFYWDDVNKRLGIGVTPLSDFHVKSSALNNLMTRFESSTGAIIGGFGETSLGDGVFTVRDSAGAIKTSLHSNANSYILNGNVGIGTNSPAYSLHVVETGDNTIRIDDDTAQAVGVGSGIKFVAKYNDAGIYTDGAKITMEKETGTTGEYGFGLALWSRENLQSTSEKVRITGDGNVGIGTSSPGQALDIERPSGTATFLEITQAGWHSYHLGMDVSSADFKIKDSSSGTEPFIIEDATPNNTLYLDDAGNVGIGTDSPAAKLDIFAKANDASNPGFKLDTLTRTITDTVFEITGSTGSNGVFIKNDGKVGIGTTAPSHKLHIKDTQDWIRLEEDGGTTNKKNYDIIGVDDEIRIRAKNDANSFVRDIITLEHDGNVGIGTTAPAQKLHIDGGAVHTFVRIQANDGYHAGMLGFQEGSQVFAMGYSDTTDTLNLVTGTNLDTINGIAIDTTGKVGIGTTSPAAKLDLYQASNDNVYLHFGNTVTGATAADGVLMGLGTDEQFNIINYENTDIDIFTSGSQRMTIKNDGNVGIGTTAPTEKLDINSDAIRIRTPQTPASSSATGITGTIAWDTSYFYVCVGTDSWKRMKMDATAW